MAKDPARHKEDEWFLKHERAFLEKIRYEREKRMEARRRQQEQEELERLRREHWMKCPKCGHDLEAVDMDGIEVDQCTFCEGVYFDRGELEALLLERARDRRSFFRRLLGLA